MCEEYESLHDRSGRPDMVMGQSIVLSAVKAEVSLDCDDPTNQDLLLQQYGERIEKLSQQDKLSKFCMDAGFLSDDKIGQYFMTKDTGDLKQFHAVACREYTLPREDGSSQPRGWIQGNTKIGPVLEVTTSCLHGKHGVEIRIWSLSGDNTHSWVRISHGSNKFVMDSNNNHTDVPEDQLEEQALKLNAKDIVGQTKAKAKPQRKEPAEFSSRIIPMDRRHWIDIEPGKHSLSAYEISKKVIHLLRHQHAILRAIVHNNPTSPASESAWKALVLSSWLLLGRPAVNASESNCAHYLDARLELFWAEDWSALWAMVRAECDVAPVQNTTRRTEKQQMQSRIRKVATLARTGEKGRALAAARNAPPVPVTEQIVQEIKSLYPADPEPPAPASAPISALFLSEVAEHVPIYAPKDASTQ